MAPQRLQMQSDALFGRHLGIGGAPATADNPRGYVGGNPFDKGFFKSTAAQLTPQQLADSQGGNAMNQWAFPGRYQWQAPPTMSAAEGAAQASPKPFQISPQPQEMLANYRGTGSAAPQGPRQVRRAQPVSGQPRPGRSYGFM